MSYVIQASPLSKMFQRRYQAQCKKDPEFLFSGYDKPGPKEPKLLEGTTDEEKQLNADMIRKYEIEKKKFLSEAQPFEIVVPRTFGSLTFVHNKPVHFSKILNKRKDHKHKDHDPVMEEEVVKWLTTAKETDIYGIVDLSVALDINAIINDLLSMPSEAGQRTYAEMKKDLAGQVKSGLENARERADTRVREQLKMTHNNLLKSYETLRQEGKGVYTPSTCEMLGSYILRTELEAMDKENRDMISRFDDNMRKNMGL